MPETFIPIITLSSDDENKEIICPGSPSHRGGSNAYPHPPMDFILARVSETVAQRQKDNAAANSRLQLPGCVDSWFADDYRHLRYTAWDVVLPIVWDMGLRTNCQI